MSVYYAHSVSAINDLLCGRIEALPVVVFDHIVAAKKFPDLVPVHQAKCYGIYQISQEHVPVFIVSNKKFLYGENGPSSRDTLGKIVVFPEMAGDHNTSVQRPDGKYEKADFVNETITLTQLLHYLYKLYSQGLYDWQGIELDDISLFIPDTIVKQGEHDITIAYLSIGQTQFQSRFKDIKREEDGSMILTAILEE